MNLDPKTLEKMEWSRLLSNLAQHSVTAEGKATIEAKVPKLTFDEVMSRWRESENIRELVRQGFRAPMSDLKTFSHLFLKAEKGSLLDGPELREILELLMATKKLHSFAQDFSQKSFVLARVKSQLMSLPKLAGHIERSVGPSGDILDDASPELKSLRRLKVGVRQKIEDQLSKWMASAEGSTYLQDQYFTVRSDRYVVPVRIDGRGRVKGSIFGTSESGQTMFLEPPFLAPLNEQLQEIDVAEKIEILRILRELSAEVATELETLKTNYQEIVRHDILQAEALYALSINAGSIELSEKPVLNLKDARHPLVRKPDGSPAIGNDIALKAEQNCLIISGPNAGGKTVVLKTVGLLHAMAGAGLLVPCDQASSIYLFRKIFVEMGDAQSLAANLSTFSGHLMGLKPILEQSSDDTLALLDELATGTEPQTGASIGQAVIEHISHKKTFSIITTHYDLLKNLAATSPLYRNASMDYSATTMKPSYKLVLDIPGQSYGLELATEIGFPKSVIERARELRGVKLEEMDATLLGLAREREQTESRRKELEEKLVRAEEEKDRWQHECELLQQTREKAARALQAKYEDQINGLKEEIFQVTEDLKKALKKAGESELQEQYLEGRKKAREGFEKSSALLKQIGEEFAKPAEAQDLSKLSVGEKVFVVPLGKKGVVKRMLSEDPQTYEVEVGLIKMKAQRKELQKGDEKHSVAAVIKTHTKKAASAQPLPAKPKVPGLVIRGAQNSLDVRGQEAMQAVNTVLDFVDRAMLRGEESLLIIHGHGSDRLKSEIRTMLKDDCPYNISWRPGMIEEGGDGVTVIGIS